eukprot:scaffold654_cov274-Pinguiococcus_pyrenoidosus.AAC.4
MRPRDREADFARWKRRTEGRGAAAIPRFGHKYIKYIADLCSFGAQLVDGAFSGRGILSA